MSLDGVLNQLDGILFLILMGSYLTFLIGSNQIENIDEDLKKEKFNWINTSILLLLGFTFTIIGADFAIDSASQIALSLGVSQWIIGLFLIALGTSLPELTISIKAALSNNSDFSKFDTIK